MMIRRLSAFLGGVALFAAPALAQNVPVYATGALTPGHALVLQQTGTPSGSVVKDAGPALAGNFTELGITNDGLPFCIRDKAQQHILCFGANVLGGGAISFQPIGNAPPTGFNFFLNGVKVPVPGTVTGLPEAVNNAALQALASSFAPWVVRTSFAAAGDAPALFYYSSGLPCTLNSGAGDNGSQVQSSDGKCWIAVFPSSGVDPREFGASSSGDVSAQLNAAAAYAAPAGLPLWLPGQTLHVCANSFAPPNNTMIYGMPQAKIQTLPGCAAGGALTYTVLLPTNPTTVYPITVMGRMQNITIDGYGLSQYVLACTFNCSKWAFPGVTVLNAKPSTVTQAATNAAQAVGSTTLTFASAQNVVQGSAVDDLTRPGVIPGGALINSCTPTCSAATSIGLSTTITNWDDGTGVGSGDTIRFMTPTANVLLTGGYEYDFATNFNIENANEEFSSPIYTSQTTLPMACIYIPGASDSSFGNMIAKNCLYGVLDPNGFGNVFGPHAHVWGQGINNPAGQPFDLRVQYGFALGSADHIIGESDADDPQIAGIYVNLVAGVPGGRIRDFVSQWTGIPAGGWGSVFGVLMGSGYDQAEISGVRGFDLLFQGFPGNVVYQRGVPGSATIVRDNPGALYTTTGRTLDGSALVVNGNQTTFLGPAGQSATDATVFRLPNTCQLTGLLVTSTGPPGAGQSYVFTVQDGPTSTPITGTISGATQVTVGSLAPPANTALADVNAAAGDAISIKAVMSAGAGNTNLTYRVYTNCP